jgi:hypothetical protein
MINQQRLCRGSGVVSKPITGGRRTVNPVGGSSSDFLGTLQPKLLGSNPYGQ